VTRGERPLPKRPFRDAFVVYAGLAGFVVAFGLLTGSGLVQTILIACAFLVLATAYTWWRLRQRIQREGRHP
jgi:membrane protein implicated in regulation of membrane protease activity